MRDSPDLVSIEEAAERAGVSRRTVERWIASNKLNAFTSESDRRKRLVRLEDIERLVGHTLLPAIEKSQERETTEPEAAYQEIIDQALQLMYSHIYRTVANVAPAMFVPQTMDQLRSGPLGRDLVRLALIARGKVQDPKLYVLKAINSILQLLFWPAASDDYTVPRSFWDTELGRMMALAKFRAFEPKDLVSIGSAAQQLGITRPTIERWMDDRTLDYIRDNVTGQTFIVRSDIEKLKRLALELADSKPTDHNETHVEAATSETEIS